MLRENLHRPGISIHALRKESDREGPSDALALAISIHALRKESDDLVGGGSGRDVISIHALRKESDSQPRWTGISRRYFNPRSP